MEESKKIEGAKIQAMIDSIHRKLTEAATTIVQGVNAPFDFTGVQDDQFYICFELETVTSRGENCTLRA